VETGSRNLRDTAESREAGQRYATGRGIGDWRRIGAKNARLSEGSRIAEPAEFAVGIVVEAEVELLAREEGAATRAFGCTRGARQADWLTILERTAPVDAPTADELICPTARTGHEMLAL